MWKCASASICLRSQIRVVLIKPVKNVFSKFAAELDQFGGFLGAGAACRVVFDGVAFDAAAVEIFGIGFLSVTEYKRRAWSVRKWARPRSGRKPSA